ncbi:unnamed protein product [Leuciscus chuanchicus]
MRHRRIRGWKWAALWLFAFSLLWNTVGAQIRYTIPEELKEGSIVGNIAKDLGFDISDIAERKLRIASESNRQYFSVDSGKGDLVVNGRIDRETLCGQSASCLMPLQIVIENPLQMHNVEIEIQDINDNAPNFHTKDATLKISELIAPGTRFTLESAEDLDVGSNSLKSYSLSNNNYFRLNVKTIKDGRIVPELVVEKPLDREKQAVHQLILTALDGGNPVKSGTSLLQIIVQDINDNEPKFEVAAYKASVLESAVVGSSVIKIKATDLDEGPNGEIQYSFGAHTPELVRNAFTVNAETGEITVIGKLDYETKKTYTFDVCAKDNGNPELEGQSSVQIDIIDENDNPPEIILTSIPSPVPENATVGTVVALITVKDLDSEYSVEILAIDSGVPPLKTVKTINIKVLDDDSSQRLMIEIKDNGEPIQSTTVTVDILIEDGFHEPISDYREKTIEPNKKSGKITLYLIISLAAVSLLCLMTFFILLVKCARGSSGGSSCCIRRTDSGYKNPNRNLQIQLNTDGPIKYVEVLGGDMMSQSQSFGSYLSPMSEFSDLTLVKPSSTTNFTDTLNVLDASLPDSAWTFESQQVPELVLEKHLDREKKPMHQLMLTAIDGGNPVRSGTSQINVTVLDINDNNPVFEKNVYKVAIAENSKQGTTFLKVEAKDLDEGPNGEIKYSLGEHMSDALRSLFNIDEKTGEMFLNGELDYETTPMYNIEIRARDRGVPEMEGHCTVKIEVSDINDNPPQILLTSKPSPLREDAPSGTVVALISARDIDSGDNGKVRLQTQSGLPFILKPSFSNEYSLVTNGVLDRETFPEYNVEITAFDSGSPPLSSKTIIPVKILDVNDNSPKFSDSVYHVYIRENNTPGSIIWSVSARDVDVGVNGKISYSIENPKAWDTPISSYLYINSDNGSIFSMHSFDFEKIKVFEVIVQAKDHGSPSLSSNATVYVFILDQNDNAPAVIYPSTSMGSVPHQRMPRSAKAGHLVTKVTAVDADSGHNAWLFYRLAEATDASLFSVNLHTGEVRTKRAVSEQDDSSQRLMIEIKDNGSPELSTTVTVDILIEDGFHEPISDYYKKNVEPRKKSGKITLYLIISLAAVSLLSLVTFFILLVKCARGSRGGSSCCIRRTDSGYKNPNRNLQIQLNTDGPIKYVEVLGGDMMSQSQSFGSYLSPMSEFSDLTLVKPSSTTNFTDTLNVLDASLPDSAWTFESQQISLQNPLEMHSVTIEIVDVNDNAPLFQSRDISLEVSEAAAPDVNDNAPHFHIPTKRVTLSENSPHRSLVATLNASDADHGRNGEISYMFDKYTPDNVLKLFSVDSVTGEIRVTGLVDHELANVYDVTILARDKGIPPMEGSCNIKIEIIDVNDNTPAITINVVSPVISEDVSSGTVIALIKVRDEDTGENGEVSVHIPYGLPFKMSSPYKGLFTLMTDGQLDREALAEYTITVIATDSGSPLRSSQESFVLCLSDVNDNPPVFSQPSYSVDIAENNAPNAPLLSVSASDPDVGENSTVSFSILESEAHSMSVSSYVYINPDSGQIYAMRKFDYEQLNAFQFVVRVLDRGSPGQSSNTTVHVFIKDQNDHPPVLIYPAPPSDGTLQFLVPSTLGIGYLVNRITFVDGDSGHNAWLFYRISGLDAEMFHIGAHTGELRTARKLTAEDNKSVFSLTVIVKDNGRSSLSASVVVNITLAEKASDASSERMSSNSKRPTGPDLTLYLIITLSFIIAVSFLAIIVLAVRWLGHRGYIMCLMQKLGFKHTPREHQHNDLHLQLNTDGPVRYMEVVGASRDFHKHTYAPGFSTISSRSDFVFVKAPQSALSMRLSKRLFTHSLMKQKPPNSDWRFPPNQRPGPSGAGVRPDEAGAGAGVIAGTGPWPNPPTEAEQLQALMAAANASEATATLGPRYNLQYGPEYRQNVYIPGSTATLTANPQQQVPQQALPPPQALPPAEVPKAAQTPASKKKPTKKDKNCLADISTWMKEHHLQLNLAKTELLVLPANPSLQYDFTIQLDSSSITPSRRRSLIRSGYGLDPADYSKPRDKQRD